MRRLRNIALKSDRRKDRQTDGQTTDKVIPMCRYTLQVTQKLKNVWYWKFPTPFLWAKTVVAIVPTRSYTQSAKVDLDIWPHDPKSIWFLSLSSTTYMWSLKVIELKLKSVLWHLYTECKKWPWPLTLWSKIKRVPLVTWLVWKWLE